MHKGGWQSFLIAEKGWLNPTDEQAEGGDGDTKSDNPRSRSRALRMEHYRSSSRSVDDHHLKSITEGSSEVEQLTRRIEQRHEDRLPITDAVRDLLIRKCREIQQEKGYPVSRIRLDDLRGLRDDVHAAVEKKENSIFKSSKHDAKLLEVLNRALEQMEVNHEDEWFHFMDFFVYYTQGAAEWPILKNPVILALLWVIAFYIFTAIFFCNVMKDEGVCESNLSGQYGWISAIYFGSETVSTVGFGDLHVNFKEQSKALAGIFYMILSNVTLFFVFSSGRLDGSTSSFQRLNEYLVEKIIGSTEDSHALYEKIFRLRLIRVSQIVVIFTLLNLIGATMARFHSLTYQNGEHQMTWIVSLYWAVQATTTIGYGDVQTPYELRWFESIYLIVSTYFVGRTVQSLATLQQEIDEVKIMTMWKRRELSKGLIEELQPEDNDGKVDQYEFLVASLVTLKKIDYDDVKPIMDKYRELANDRGFISIQEGKSRVTTKDLTDPLERSTSLSRMLQMFQSGRSMRFFGDDSGDVSQDSPANWQASQPMLKEASEEQEDLEP